MTFTFNIGELATSNIGELATSLSDVVTWLAAAPARYIASINLWVLLGVGFFVYYAAKSWFFRDRLKKMHEAIDAVSSGAYESINGMGHSRGRKH